MRTLEVLFTPADFSTLEARDLSDTVCVVFDVLRATSSIVTALAHGAIAIMPVAEISEALSWRVNDPVPLLAGERDGVRILSNLTGSVDFDLGNSPREFTATKVNGRLIVMTTTNGTRALRACARAWNVLISSFLNLTATAELLRREPPKELIVVCSGTYEQAAYEDVLAAGNLCELLLANSQDVVASDSAEMARRLFLLHQDDLQGAMAYSRNARRLMANSALAEDVAFSLQRDRFNFVADLGSTGWITQRPN